MAFIFPFDPTRPTGADLVSKGDNEFRDLKSALQERLSQVFANWPDGDPLVFAQGVGISVQVGLESERPAAPSALGQVWYSHDVDRLFIAVPASDASGVRWQEFRPLGTQATFTATNTSTCAGTVPTYKAQLAWTLVSTTGVTTKISRDGTYIASVVGAKSYTDSALTAAGKYTYTIVHETNGVPGTPISQTLNIADPCAAGTPEGGGGGSSGTVTDRPTSLSVTDQAICSGGSPAYDVRLSWTNPDQGKEIKVFHNGANVATLPAATSTYNHSRGTFAGPSEYYLVYVQANATNGPASSIAFIHTEVNPCNPTGPPNAL